MRDTIDMAFEANLVCDIDDPVSPWPEIHDLTNELKAFEALVRADQDEKYKWDIHSCGPTCEKYACVAMREAVEAEREACAKVCDEMGPCGFTGESCAEAIRARGNT